MRARDYADMSAADRDCCHQAREAAAHSHDPAVQVGALVSSKEGRVVARGCNSLPNGVRVTRTRLSDRELKLELIVHAEINALISAGHQALGGTLFVWGRPVCARCAGPIIQAGVVRVVMPSPESAMSETGFWARSGRLAADMFEEAGVAVDVYSLFCE